MSIQLLRESRLFVSTVDTGFTTANTMEILIQDDLSFGVGGNSTDITVNEAGPKPTRGSKRFNDSLNPADWSFSTYILPYLDEDTNKIMLPDYMLWHALTSGEELDPDGDTGFHTNKTNAMVDFKASAFHELAKLNIYIRTGNVWYQIKKVQVNQAELNIDIENIGMVTWSGNGTELIPLKSQPFDVNTLGMSDELYLKLQESYLVNKLTIMRVKDNQGTKKVYDIPITGASFSINNNITYLTPNTLSRVDRPIASFTGSISITGNLTAYLNTNPLGTAEIYDDLLSNLATVNSYEVAFIVGGEYADPKPAAIFMVPTANLSVPTLEVDDVLGTQIEFSAEPTEMDAGDQAVFGFSPIYTKTLVDKFLKDRDADTPDIP